ncbi:MAG: hypothetical protein Kow0047_14610 [Anaerolineae bacterium]
MNVERWQQGTPLAEYIQNSSARGRILRRLAEVSLSDEVSRFFKAYRVPTRAIVITEDWCPGTPPAVATLAHCCELSDGAIEARVYKRDRNPDLMDQFLKEGKYRSIPVVAFFDSEFTPLGDIREKPVLPEWEGLHEADRGVAALSLGWSETWARAFMAILAPVVEGQGE